MTDTAHRARQPKGSPTGGEFATEAGTEASVRLVSFTDANIGRAAELAASPDEDVRLSIAHDPHLPLRVSERLSRDWSVDVRVAIAENTATPATVLTVLAADAHSDVRFSAAGNPAMPVPSLEVLGADRYLDVRRAAITNPSMPLSKLRAIADSDVDDDTAAMAQAASKCVMCGGYADGRATETVDGEASRIAVCSNHSTRGSHIGAIDLVPGSFGLELDDFCRVCGTSISSVTNQGTCDPCEAKINQ